jgi:osmoprotectant transport system permease protein
MKRALVILLLAGCGSRPITIGSKKFTESVLIAELAAQLARSTGAEVTLRHQLGGTQLLFSALESGAIDAYPEYTGTIDQEIFHGRTHSDDERRRALADKGLAMSGSLGFDDTYAIGMKEERAQALGIRTLSDLARHPEVKLGFSEEFLARADGWPSVQKAYRLPQTEIRGLDHDLAYRGLEAGTIDATDLYSTDAEIAYYKLRVLDDDRRLFPEYRAVVLYRASLASRAPGVVRAIEQLVGHIDERTMRALNARAKLDKQPEPEVAQALLAERFGLDGPAPARRSVIASIGARTLEHLLLVALSLGAAILVGVPLGIFAARRPRLGQAVLALCGVLQTIPSLALLVFMIPLFGIGATPAIVALFLYSLLPIVRNTTTGLRDLPPWVRESADALGLPGGARLRLVELPMASRAILAGIKTSAVINVGTATLGAVIGAGGYGQPILTGIRLDDLSLILQGAIPAALLALLVQGGFEALDRLIVPKGLRP